MTAAEAKGKLEKTVRKAPIWGTAWTAASAAEFADTLAFARLGYWAEDEAAYRLGCYSAAKALTSLWAAGTAYPKWFQEKNFGSAAKLSLENAAPEQLRFIKDRMPEYAKQPAAEQPKTGLIWKDGPWTPKPDWMFRRGMQRLINPGAAGQVLSSTSTATNAALRWHSPAGISLPDGKTGEGLPLCGISEK
jgi:hypothetical protein